METLQSMKKEVSIPIEVVSSNLTLEEIGTICVVMFLPSMTEEIMQGWAENRHFESMIRKMKNSGILKLTENGENGDEIEIDLTDR